MYDPLGIVAPVILPAKKILQDLCRNFRQDWDETVPECILLKWQERLSSLPSLHGFAMDRCVKPASSDMVSKQLHGFCDASNIGYGAAVYLRQEDHQGRYHVSFLIGKARLAPLKATTIPRLELTAAVVLVRLVQLMKTEMGENTQAVYHTDSTTVLRYISNDQRRFPVFVANRVRIIRDFSQPEQWKYIPSQLNPSDCASRGFTMDRFISSCWVQGPAFLREQESRWEWKVPEDCATDDTVDVAATCILERQDVVNQLIGYYSDWYRLKRTVAVYRKVMVILKDKVSARKRNNVS